MEFEWNLNGILAKPSPKRGKTIADEVVDTVKQFFCNNSYSRLMSGKKDLYSVQKNMNKSFCYCVIFQNFILILSKILLK